MEILCRTLQHHACLLTLALPNILAKSLILKIQLVMLKLVISLLEALNGERRLICEPSINTFWDINVDLADEPRKTLVKLTVQIHVLTARLMVWCSNFPS